MKDDFAKYLTRFFTSYLSGERGLSHNTIRAYGNTFLSFIDFMEKTRCIKADRISLEHLTQNNVSDFLHWTEENKGCGTATRNQKLSAFHTFCKYMLYTDIFHLDQWQSILSIKSKHCEKQSVSYLSIDGIRLLLSLIPVNTRNGLRDLALIALLYDSGARVQELIDLTPTDLHLVKPYYVSLFGKGRKRRLVPLQEQQVELLKKVYGNRRSVEAIVEPTSFVCKQQRGKTHKCGGNFYFDEIREECTCCRSESYTSQNQPS